MSNKQAILDAIQTMSDDVVYDDVIEQLYFLKKLDRAIEQADRGDVLDHDEFFDQLMREDEENATLLDKPGPVGLAKHSRAHRAKSAPNRSRVHKPAAKVRG